MACPEATLRGAAVLVSGRTGKILHIGYGGEYDRMDWRVEGVGDVDRDGVPDFAGGGSWGPGIARAFSGRTGALLHSWPRPRQNTFGTALAGRVDVDQDGYVDVFVTSPGGNMPDEFQRVYAFSGRDGRLLYSVYVPELGLGQNPIATVPRTADNPFPLLAVSAETITNVAEQVGSITLWRMMPAASIWLGEGCADAAGQPRIGLSPEGGARGRISVSGVEPGAPCALLMGLSSSRFGALTLPFDLASVGLPGCMLRTSVDFVIPVAVPVSGTYAGYGHVDLPWRFSGNRNDPALHWQWLCLTSGGLKLSGAVTTRFLR
jgi:hypothetical protein